MPLRRDGLLGFICPDLLRVFFTVAERTMGLVLKDRAVWGWCFVPAIRSMRL